MTSQQRDPIALAINRQHHEAGEHVNLPYPLIRALAWRVASELIRRHPDKLRVIETHPGGGQYDCVKVLCRDREESLIVYLNLVGHLTHGAWFQDSGGSSELSDVRFNWLDVLGTEDLRQDIIEPLEASSGLTSPKATPVTTDRSIGPRLLARFASAAAFSTRTWHILNAVEDTTGMGSGLRPWVRDISGPSFERVDGDLANQPAYRYWFVLDHEGTPAAVIDVDFGLAWRRDQPGVRFNLMERYEQLGSSVDRLAAEVLPPVE